MQRKKIREYTFARDHHPIGQGDVNSFAVVALIIVVGFSAYLWWTGRLRGAAAFVTLAGIIVLLVYAAFFASQPPA